MLFCLSTFSEASIPRMKMCEPALEIQLAVLSKTKQFKHRASIRDYKVTLFGYVLWRNWVCFAKDTISEICVENQKFYLQSCFNFLNRVCWIVDKFCFYQSIELLHLTFIVWKHRMQSLWIRQLYPLFFKLYSSCCISFKKC